MKIPLFGYNCKQGEEASTDTNPRTVVNEATFVLEHSNTAYCSPLCLQLAKGAQINTNEGVEHVAHLINLAKPSFELCRDALSHGKASTTSPYVPVRTNYMNNGDKRPIADTPDTVGQGSLRWTGKQVSWNLRNAR